MNENFYKTYTCHLSAPEPVFVENDKKDRDKVPQYAYCCRGHFNIFRVAKIKYRKEAQHGQNHSY